MASNGPLVQNSLQPTELPAPVAAPVSVGNGGSRIGDFLSAIGKLSPQIGTALQNVDQAQGDAAEAQANHTALTASPQDLRAEIASGNYFGMAHRRAQAALKVMDATNRAFDVSSQLDGMEKRGELNSADPQQVLNTVVQPHADAISDPLAQKAFDRTLGPVMQRFRLATQTATIANDMQNKQANLLQYAIGLHSQVDQDHAQDAEQDGFALDAEASQAAHKRAMFQTADYAKDHLLMPQAQIEKVMGEAAAHFAYAGNQNVLAALGSYDRGGAPLSTKFGVQWDAWTKQAETAADRSSKEAANNSADSLTAEAMRAQGKPEEFNARVDAALAANPKDFPEAKAEHLKNLYASTVAAKAKHAADTLAAQQEAQVEKDFQEQGTTALMAGNGSLFPEKVRFTAADGKERVFSRKDYMERMYQGGEARIDAQAQAEGWTQDQTELAKTKLYSRNRDTRPVFQSAFDDLFAGSRAGIPPGGNAKEQLSRLEYLRTNDAEQFANLAGTGRDGGKQELWLASFRAAREFGSDPERALNIANQRTFNPAASERLSKADVDGKVDDVLKAWTRKPWFGSGVGVAMGPIARAKAADAVSLQIAAGVADKDIADKAAESLGRSHLVVNGIPAHNNLPGVASPQVAVEYLTDGAKFFKDSHPALKDQPYALGFADAPEKPGSYAVVRSDTGERISNSTITGGQLKDYVLQWRDHTRIDDPAEIARSKNPAQRRAAAKARKEQQKP